MKSNEHLSYLLAPKGGVRQIGPETGRSPRNGIGVWRSPYGSLRYVYLVEGVPVAAIQVMTRGRELGTVANAYTQIGQRRRGLASALVSVARRDFKTLAFGTDRSEDGASFVTGVGGNPARDDGRYRYVMSCTDSTFEDIRDMLDSGAEREISRATFARKVGRAGWHQIQSDLGYGRDFSIARDWHVYYARSIFRGVPCVFLRHSAIEHIFTLDGVVGPSMANR